jgi:hypothetical protein
MSNRGFSVGFALAAAWLCTLPLITHSAEQRYECPLWIKPDAFKADHPPDGWTAVMPQEWRLEGGGLLHGDPNESGYLKPYDAKISKNGNQEIGVMRWRLGQPPHPHETWLYCGYGPLQLFKRIPLDAVECTATSKTDSGFFVETIFVCQ